MIVWVDDNLFEHGARDVDLVALLRNAAMRRHTVIISTDPALPRSERTSPCFDRWRESLAPRLQTEIELLRMRLDRVSANSVTRGAARLMITPRELPGVAGCRLNLEEAVRAVGLPLCILVENQINDAAFLRKVMPPAWRERLGEWERRGELRYENGGGAPVVAALLRFHADDKNARLFFGLPAEAWRLLHFVVFDHDGDCQQSPGDQSATIAKACKDAQMESRSHRLMRRDQEHYIPPEALQALVTSKAPGQNQTKLLEDLAAHGKLGERRHFTPLPRIGRDPFFKNAFSYNMDWPDQWYLQDGAWPEMTELAEKIAAAM